MSYSPEVVPEPSTLVLGTLAALGMSVTVLCRQRTKSFAL
jgi:hypothetical protein